MGRLLCGLGLLLVTTGPAAAFVPYAHEGMAVVPMDSRVITARARFQSDVSSFGAGVLVKIDLALEGGAEGYLTVDVQLAGVGQEARSIWRYYEKSSPDLVRFEATEIQGRVVVADRFEKGPETSVRLELEAILSDGTVTRRLEGGYAVTAPSPSVLRSGGQLPSGVVVLDNGSGAFAAGYRYNRGVLDCTGEAADVVVLDESESDYWEEVEIIDEIVIIDDSGDGASDPGGYEPIDSSTDDYTTTTDYTTDTYSDGDSASDFGCGGDPTTTTDSSDDSSGGLDCEGDVEAAGSRRGERFRSAPLSPERWARLRAAERILQLSPMLLLLLGLLLLREREPWRRRTTHSAR